MLRRSTRILSLIHPKTLLPLPRRPFSVEAETPSVLETLSDTLISLKPLNKPQAAGKNSLNQPKWMRFFNATEPLKIDLERSIKTENLEMIQNYVRLNYVAFDFGQLVMSLEKRLSKEINEKLFQEIKLRIVTDTEQRAPELLLSLLNYSLRSCLDDELVSSFLLKELTALPLSVFPQIQGLFLVMRFCLAMNRLQPEKLNEFIDRLAEWRKANSFKDLQLKDLNNLMATLSFLRRVMPRPAFSSTFDKPFIEGLFSAVEASLDLQAQRENPDFLIDLGDVKLVPSPEFLTYEQQNRYKLMLATLIFEQLNEESNFGRFNPVRLFKSELLRYFARHFDRTDRHILKQSLPLLCHAVLKDNYLRKNPSIYTIIAKFGVVNPFFLNETLSYLQSNLRKFKSYSEVQPYLMIRTFFEANYEDILYGSAGNEYLRTSWELINRNLIEMLMGAFGKRDRFNSKFEEFIAYFREGTQAAERLESEVTSEEDQQIALKTQSKLASLQEALETVPRIRLYASRAPVQVLITLKILFLLIDLMKSLALRFLRKKGISNGILLDYFKSFMNEKSLGVILDSMPLMPGLAENICFLEDFYRAHVRKELFEGENGRVFRDVKSRMNEMANKGDGNEVRAIIESLKGLGLNENAEWEWQDNAFITIEEACFYRNPTPQTATPVAGLQLNQPQPDLLAQKFALTTQNLGYKLLHSRFLYHILNESMLKRIFYDLFHQEPNFVNLRMNVVDFPAFADFTFEFHGNKLAVIVMDHEKHLLGVEDVAEPYIVMSKCYWEMKGYKVWNLKYADYDVDSERFKLGLRNSLLEFIKPAKN